jgi:DNA-directed RNA polymerase subunit F
MTIIKKERYKMLETILSKLGLPFLISSVAKALGGIDNPVAKTAAESLSKVEKAIANGTITIEQTKEAHRHIEAMARVDAESLKEINHSLRAEIESQDPYVRRMRPTFGYLMAFTWTLQMSALAYIMVFEIAQASLVIEAVESLSAIWAVALSVLGIYVYKRSEDKKLR